ncbi:MAG: response regulator [Nitrospinaceae bacterium]|nr:response regulator [Nitrospinaceae bacterium]
MLTVEDGAQPRTFMSQYFEEEGCIIEVAEDGEDALKKYDPFQPYLVLLDLMLPGLNGLQVLKELKKKAPSCFHPKPSLSSA